MHKGSCLCGKIKFEVEGDLNPPSACHCTMCRKQTGHYEAGTDVPRSCVKIFGEENITWYKSSEKVRRGLCSTCGSFLFFGPMKRYLLLF
jgi:hypothetical protein